MATTTVTLHDGSAVYHRGISNVPSTTPHVDRRHEQNFANLATAMNTLALRTALTDPGDAGAIPVTTSGHVPIVTAGAETRTLAVPSFAGQLLLIHMKTDGGDCTITVAQAINANGDTSIVLGDVMDFVLLVGVNSGNNLRWRVVANGGVPSVSRGGLENDITDPGNAGAIPVTDSGTVQIVTAGAETRTLAAPTILGQQLLITMKTDGGDAVITVSTTVNQTGNNTITLNDAGDAVLLVAKQNGANLRWSVVSNDGASLTTV